MQSRPALVLDAVLRVMRPLVRLLVRHGVAYPAFAGALKQVFLSAAADELQRLGRKQTDSAMSLLSGVHRRDVRTLARPDAAGAAMERPTNLASEIAARWLSDRSFSDAQGRPKALARAGGGASFESLASSISSDVRPRAMLDEMIRLGVVEVDGDRVSLAAKGFAPHKGFDAMARLFADNLCDHASAAGLNVEGGHNYLDQAVFSDGLTRESVQHLRKVSADAWQKALQQVLREVQKRYDHDRRAADASQRVHRFRFGSYSYSSDDHERPA